MMKKSAHTLAAGACSIAFAFLLLLWSSPLQAGTCTLSSSGTYSQADLETCAGGSLTGLVVDAGVTLTLSGSVTINGDAVLNGTLTQAAEDPDGINLNAANLTISSTGSINADAKGCRGSDGGDGYYAMGPDPNNGNQCAYRATGAGGYQYGGGNHGGYGGSTIAEYTPQTYDSQTAPAMLGSGGGGAPSGAGYGGGLIFLNLSGTLTLEGKIEADGQNGGYNQSGGSGGSIYVRAGALAGSGSISANGGDGNTYGGGGGGGRIAAYYDTLSNFALSNVTANGGTGGWISSEKGTTFLLNRRSDDGSGNLTVTSGLTFTNGGDFTRTSISIGEGALLRCENQTALNISTTGAYTDAGSTWTCPSTIGTVNFSVGSALSVASISWSITNTDAFNLTASSFSTSGTNAFTFNKAGSQAHWNLTNDLTLNNFTYTGGTAGFSSYQGGVLFIDDPIHISLVNSEIQSSISWRGIASLSVDANSSIDSSGKGCSGALASPWLEGYGPNLNDSNYACGSGDTTGVEGAGRYQYGGAGHCSAGEGFYGPPSTTYDQENAPFLPGSGGGGGSSGGSFGGGTVRLSVTGSLDLAGSILANAGSPGSFQGGGSGGSVWINASTVSGSGHVYSNGEIGNGYGTPGGAGYVALYYGSLDGFSAAQLESNGIDGHTADCTPYVSLNPALEISPSDLSLDEGSSGSFSISLKTAPLDDVVVSLSSSNSAEGSVSPASLTFNSSNWSTPQTVTVTASDDDTVDGSSSFEIQLSTSSNDPDYDGLSSSVLVSVNDNDHGGGTGSPALNLSIQGPTQELEIGDNADYSITASNSGDADAEQVVLTITLPESLRFLSADVQASDASLANASASASCSAQGQSVVCALGSLAQASSMTVWLSARVVQGGSLELQAVLQSENGGGAEASGGSGSQAIASDLQGSCALQKGPSRPPAAWIFAFLLLSPLLVRIRLQKKKR